MVPIKSRFNYGDKVMINTNGNDKTGKIISIFKNNNGDIICRVKFISPTVIPNEMEFKQEYLKEYKNEFESHPFLSWDNHRNW